MQDVALSPERGPAIARVAAPAAADRASRGSEAPAQSPLLIRLGPLLASWLAIAIGSMVLIGWTFGLEPLKRVAPGFVAMNPATAILFIFSGLSLALILGHPARLDGRAGARLFAAIVVLAAMAELLELLGLWDSILDNVLFGRSVGMMDHGHVNRMAPNTALNFLLVGMSLLMLQRARLRSVAQAFAVVIGFAALLPITGYAYGVQSFSGITSFIPMALHTAATFLILAGGLFFAVPETRLSQAFTTDDTRGVLARQLLPATVLVTLCLGWLRLWGERQGWYDTAFGTALYAVTLTVLLTLLVRWCVRAVGKVEAERAAAQARLAALSRRKDEMVAVVSHDLCSPLTGFRLVIDLLREKNEPTEDLLNLMDHSAKRMVMMVRGLLDVSKLQNDEAGLERESVRVSDLLRQSIEPLTINANAKHITLRLEVSPEEPLLEADPLRLSQIFNNLLSNAVKFTAPGGRVTAKVLPDASGVRVAVEDTGLGIPKDELPGIFDKFHQTSTKATAGEPGAGLGLAIVRELVLLHGGRIDVLSEVGRGTTFTVYLPRTGGRSSEPPTAVEKAA